MDHFYDLYDSVFIDHQMYTKIIVEYVFSVYIQCNRWREKNNDNWQPLRRKTYPNKGPVSKVVDGTEEPKLVEEKIRPGHNALVWKTNKTTYFTHTFFFSFFFLNSQNNNHGRCWTPLKTLAVLWIELFFYSWKCPPVKSANGDRLIVIFHCTSA